MSMPLIRCVAAALCLSGIANAVAGDLYPWRQHAAPFEFLFGNHFDTHQQTRVSRRDGSLFGFLYIRHTGVVTRDRYPVATHVDCNMVPDCTVGWTIGGAPTEATYLYQTGNDHPVFLLGRARITQPGSPSHFHWLGAATPTLRQTVPGYLLQLTAVDKFCFIHHGADAATPNRTCQANGGINVDHGADIATHLNIVGSAPPGL